MIAQIVVVIAVAVTLPTIAHAAEAWRDAPLADDVEWRELSGDSKSTKRRLTIDELNQIQARQNKTSQNTIWGMVENTSHGRNVDCMKTLGDARFCRCLGEGLPAFLSFAEYVNIVTGTITQAHYSDLKAQERRRLVENTVKAREQCVKTSFN